MVFSGFFLDPFLLFLPLVMIFLLSDRNSLFGIQSFLLDSQVDTGTAICGHVLILQQILSSHIRRPGSVFLRHLGDIYPKRSGVVEAFFRKCRREIVQENALELFWQPDGLLNCQLRLR